MRETRKTIFPTYISSRPAACTTVARTGEDSWTTQKKVEDRVKLLVYLRSVQITPTRPNSSAYQNRLHGFGLRNPCADSVGESELYLPAKCLPTLVADFKKGDLGEYNQCQTQLYSLYSEGFKGHEEEFKAYRILYLLHTCNRADMNDLLANLTPTDKQDKSVQHALQVRSVLAAGNFHRFFKLYLEAPKMGGYLMDSFIARERMSAMCTICKAWDMILLVLLYSFIPLGSDQLTLSRSHGFFLRRGVIDPILILDFWLKNSGLKATPSACSFSATTVPKILSSRSRMTKACPEPYVSRRPRRCHYSKTWSEPHSRRSISRDSCRQNGVSLNRHSTIFFAHNTLIARFSHWKKFFFTGQRKCSSFVPIFAQILLPSSLPPLLSPAFSHSHSSKDKQTHVTNPNRKQKQTRPK